jgi:hypothetical protein
VLHIEHHSKSINQALIIYIHSNSNNLRCTTPSQTPVLYQVSFDVEYPVGVLERSDHEFHVLAFSDFACN